MQLNQIITEMQIAVLISLIFAVGVFCQDKYTSKYDSVDLDTILKNERLLKNYIDCLLDKGKCSKDGSELKKHIPEALETECSKCTDSHRNGVKKVLKHLVENNKDWLDELLVKYDPEGVYRKKYEELGKKEGIQV